jgi:hypothetical protein
MYPHERSLVKRMEDQPFALIGVNSDEDREQLTQIVQDEQITWRSWWDGGIDGPIHKQWNVLLRPTLYVLDHRGVIRFKNRFGDELDAAVDSLMEELTAR